MLRHHQQPAHGRYKQSYLTVASGTLGPIPFLAMLDNTDLSIKEIATKLNFPTQSFFGKYFKQYVGISPKEYRNKLIKQ